MSDKKVRKPIGNFFIKKDLQIRLIMKIVSAVILATAIFATTLILTYHFSYANDAFYQVTLSGDEPQIGDRLNIINIILPSLIISSIVNLVVAFFVGLYASRKYAVPIFKLEQWVNLLNEGRLSAQLRFREKEEMKELCDRCNILSENLRVKFSNIKKYADTMKAENIQSNELLKMHDILDILELEAGAVEVRTRIIHKSDRPT